MIVNSGTGTNTAPNNPGTNAAAILELFLYHNVNKTNNTYISLHFYQVNGIAYKEDLGKVMHVFTYSVVIT